MPILVPRTNVWRIEPAHRVALLVDGAAFFRAVREALLKAQRSVFIVGWDVHSQTRLVGESGEAEDGWPAVFVDFVRRLAQERPQLRFHILAWDFSMLYAFEREMFPSIALGWGTPRQVSFCLDAELPIGASHHQKIIVVDDAVAFSGGLDVTIRRWDTPEHVIDHPCRVDPAGKPYRPFHDIQALVDGDAARALAELVRERWERACEASEPLAVTGDPWPDSVTPDFTDVRVGIARTFPRSIDQDEVREVEALFLDSIDAAERTIYVENQFVTSAKIARRLADRLRARPELEVVMVVPQTHETWIESRTMRNGRIRFMRILREAGVGDRVRLVYPEVAADDRRTDVMIHSKIMVIDDRLLRVGSANLNNRSMGTDTECDLVIEASSAREHAAIVDTRNRLFGEHCGLGADAAAAEIGRLGSLVRAADLLSHEGRALRIVDDGRADPEELAVRIERVADPEQPISSETVLGAVLGESVPRLQISRAVQLAVIVLTIVGLGLAWIYSPLSALADPEVMRTTMTVIADHRFAALIVVTGYVLLGLVAFPLVILIAATAAAFGPVFGFTYAALGSLASALVTYGLGALIGKEALKDLFGGRLERIRGLIDRHGVMAVAAIRLVPIGPYTLVNVAAGAAQVRLFDFVVGTIIGLAPGLLVLSALGHQLSRIIVEPQPSEILLLVGMVLAWFSLVLGAQALVGRFLRSRT